MSNLHRRILDQYGKFCLNSVRDLESTSRKIADFRNHLRFSLRCLKVRPTVSSFDKMRVEVKIGCRVYPRNGCKCTLLLLWLWEIAYLNNTAAMVITSMLDRLPALHMLVLMSTTMEAAGFQALMEAAKKHPTLEEIVWSKGLAPEGADTSFDFFRFVPPLPPDQLEEWKWVREDADEPG